MELVYFSYRYLHISHPVSITRLGERERKIGASGRGDREERRKGFHASMAAELLELRDKCVVETGG